MSRGFSLSPHRRVWLYGTVVVLFGTGVLWLLVQHFWVAKGELGESTSQSAPLWLRIHGAAAMIFLVVLGTLLRDHVRGAWRAGKNRFSGSGLLASSTLLAASGYGLYYLGDEGLRLLLSRFHWILGILWPALIAFHIFLGRRSRRTIPLQDLTGIQGENEK